MHITGSKTSSNKKKKKKVSPKIALIGVGKNNNFGHPADITIDNLKSMNIKIYRTDEMGEIGIKINKNGKKIRIQNIFKIVDR